MPRNGCFRELAKSFCERLLRLEVERAEDVEAGRLVNLRRVIMNVQIVVRVDSRDGTEILESVETLKALDLVHDVGSVIEERISAVVDYQCEYPGHRHDGIDWQTTGSPQPDRLRHAQVPPRRDRNHGPASRTSERPLAPTLSPPHPHGMITPRINGCTRARATGRAESREISSLDTTRCQQTRSREKSRHASDHPDFSRPDQHR